MFVSQYRSELIINVAVEGTFDLGTILNTSWEDVSVNDGLAVMKQSISPSLIDIPETVDKVKTVVEVAVLKH